MALYTYDGPPDGRYSYLHTRHGIAPFTGLEPGDIVDFGEHAPPDEKHWRTAKASAVATRRPDNDLPLAPVFSDGPAEPGTEPASRPQRAPAKQKADAQ